MLSCRDLVDYFKKERSELIHAFEKLSNEEFTRSRGLSFDSLKDVFVHTIRVEDRWLHYRAAGLGEGSLIDPENYRNLRDVKGYMAEVDAKTAKLFNKITEHDLIRDVKIVYPNGKEAMYKLEEVLYHISIEIIHHYGEIFAEFWKMDADAPYYSYLAFSKDRK